VTHGINIFFKNKTKIKKKSKKFKNVEKNLIVIDLQKCGPN